MTRNQELIAKYIRIMKRAEKEIENCNDILRVVHLEAKVIAYKMFIIDLQE